MRRMICLLALLCALLLTPHQPAQAQNNRGTINYSNLITLGNTYQLLRKGENRWSITIQNNNTNTDNCFLFIGGNQITAGTTTTATSITINGVAMTAAKGSIVLAPGASWARYNPYVPNDPIYGTCATTSDSLYLDVQ